MRGQSEDARLFVNHPQRAQGGLPARAAAELRRDKAWSLTDCISLAVMEGKGISEALTGDRHFVQAGDRALLAED